MRGHPGSNQGPLDLQSNALPLSYIPYSPSLLQKCVHLYWDGTSCSNNMCVHFCTQKYVLYFSGSLAQWLEHWSCKPGVGGSIPPRALIFSLRISLVERSERRVFYFMSFSVCLHMFEKNNSKNGLWYMYRLEVKKRGFSPKGIE